MKVIKSEIKDKQLMMTVAVDQKDWKAAIDKEVNKASKNVKVNGFRPGKAPKAEVLKHLNMPEILMHAATIVANGTLKDVLDSKEYEDAKINSYPTPALDITKISETELELVYTFYEFPEATVGDYTKMKVDIITPTVTDKEVDEEINRLLSREKMFSKKDGAIAKGDVAIFDFEGYIDGEQFPGGTAEKYELEIGSETFIPGFEDQMIGLKAGHLSFPKDYHARDFAGKEVIFKVKVHEVKSVTMPKLDDAFVKSLKIGEIKDVKGLKDYIKTNIFRFKTQDANEKNVMAINKALVGITKMTEIPQIIIDDEARKIRTQLNQRLSQMNIKLEDYAKMTGKTMDDFNKEILEQAKNNIIVYGALDKISEKEKVEVTDKELNAKYEELATIYRAPVEEIKKSLDKDLLSELLLNELTIQKIISYYLKK